MKTSTFALIFGIAYLGAGLLGLVPAALMPPPADAPPTHFTMLYGYLLGLFPVNVLHSAVHLAIGVWGLAAWRGTAEPRVYARALAHLLRRPRRARHDARDEHPVRRAADPRPRRLAARAALPWWRPTSAGARRSTADRRTLAPDRRQRMLPVARERRLGLADRRSMAYSGV